MDLHTIYNEIVALRKDVQRYNEETTANKTDIAWLKKAVIGGFTFVFTILGGLAVKTMSH